MPRKAKAEIASAPEMPRLTHPETITLMLAERDLHLAMQSEKLAVSTLRSQELEAHIALTATRQALEDVKAALAQAKDKHRKLAEHLGAKYGLEWDKVSFDPETGDIVPLPDA